MGCSLVRAIQWRSHARCFNCLHWWEEKIWAGLKGEGKLFIVNKHWFTEGLRMQKCIQTSLHVQTEGAQWRLHLSKGQNSARSSPAVLMNLYMQVTKHAKYMGSEDATGLSVMYSPSHCSCTCPISSPSSAISPFAQSPDAFAVERHQDKSCILVQKRTEWQT